MGGEGDEAVEEEAEPPPAAASTAASAGCRRGHSGAHGAGHVRARAHNTTNYTCHLMFVEGVAPLGVDSLGRFLGVHTRLKDSLPTPH